MNSSLTLGKSTEKKGTGTITKPVSTEERITLMEQQLEAMNNAFYEAQRAIQEKDNRSAYTEGGTILSDANSDGIPTGATFMGYSRGKPYVLSVAENGDYYVGLEKHPSLSAAAEAVSGVRRSGWTFWKLPDGKTLKEVFKG